MRLNKVCVRDVLLYIESHCVYEDVDYETHTQHKVSFKEICDAEELVEYDIEDLRYTVEQMLDAKYVKGTTIPKDSWIGFRYAYIESLTMLGHDLLDNIRPDTVWQKTKKALARIGDFSLNFMSGVASSTMIEYIKSMANIK